MKSKFFLALLGLLSAVSLFAFLPSTADAQSVSATLSPVSTNVGTPVSVTITASGFFDPSLNVFRVDCTNDGSWEGTSSFTSLSSWTFSNVCTYATTGIKTIRFEMSDDFDFAEGTVTIAVDSPPVFVGSTCVDTDCTGPSYSTTNTTPPVTFNTDEGAWCRMSSSDVNYGSMFFDCSGGQGGASHTCNPGTFAPPVTVTWHFACRDAFFNEQSNTQNLDVTFGVTSGDTTPPVITITTIGGDTSLPYSTLDTTPSFIFGTDENAFCRYSNADKGYDLMGSDCEAGEGTRSHVCNAGVLSFPVGSNTVFLSCKDTAFPPNKHTISNNTEVLFTVTAAGGDITPPTVSSVVPAPLATGVSTGTTVQVTFSETMNASTVTTSSFTLATGGLLIPVTVSGSGVTFTLTLAPGSSLAPGTSYTVQVKGSGFCPSCVKDAAGNALATTFSSSFTTAAVGSPTADLIFDGDASDIITVPAGSTAYSWSTTNTPDSCTASGPAPWSGPIVPVSGGSAFVALTTSGVYTMTCTKGIFPPVSDSATITVNTGGCWALGVACVVGPPGCCGLNICDVGATNVCILPGGDSPPTVTMTIDSANPPLANSPVVYHAIANDSEGISNIKLFHDTGSGFVLLHTCTSPTGPPFHCVFTFLAGYPAGTNVNYKATATEGGPTPQSADSSVTSVVVAVAGCNNNSVCEGLESNASCPADCTCAAPNSCVVTGTCTTMVVAGSCPGTNVCCTPAGSGGVPTTVTIEFQNPLGSLTFSGLINNIINFLFTIAVILAPILLVVAGVIFMTAAGDPGKVKTARSMLMWTIVGFGVILISKGLVTVLKEILKPPA